MNEPTRLFESATDPALRDALREASHEAPTSAQLELLADQVASASVGTGVLAATWLKLTLGVLAVGAAVVAGRPALTREAAPSRLPAQAAHEPAIAPVVTPLVTPMVEAAREVPATPSLPTSDLPVAAAKRRTRTRDVVVPAAPAIESSSAPAAPAAPTAPPSELALLQQAQRVLRSAPKRALALVAEHRALYPNGEFREEREVTALDALATLRDASLERQAQAFLRRYPNSFHSAHVRRLLDR